MMVKIIDILYISILIYIYIISVFDFSEVDI